MAHFVAKEMFL